MHQLKKGAHKKGKGAAKVYIKVAGEILALAGYLGLSALGKKKNALLRGAALGGVAGLIAIAVNELRENKEEDTAENEIWRQRFITISLYILGGLVAGTTVKMLKQKKKKRNRWHC